MKQLTWKLVLPITIISFFIFTTWWYTLPVDAPDTMMWGFPLIWLSMGWHTSGALQIFVFELIANLLLHFLFWFALIFTINRFLLKIKIPKIVSIMIFTLTGIISFGVIWIGSLPEHVYETKRNFDIEVLDTGYKFIWSHQERPKYYDYKKPKK